MIILGYSLLILGYYLGVAWFIPCSFLVFLYGYHWNLVIIMLDITLLTVTNHNKPQDWLSLVFPSYSLVVPSSSLVLPWFFLGSSLVPGYSLPIFKHILRPLARCASVPSNSCFRQKLSSARHSLARAGADMRCASATRWVSCMTYKVGHQAVLGV